jgi:Tol biopolymer transport system component
MTSSLYLRDSDGRVRRLTGCGTCGWAGGGLSWSPDGSWIAFSRDPGRPGGRRPSLWAVNTASGKLRRLTDCHSCADFSPDWAPSGQLIVFSRTVFSRTADRGTSLYTVRADGSQLTKITSSLVAANPRWSPDGREIAFGEGGKVFTVDADGSDQKLLPAGASGNGRGTLSWSPDGTKLAYFTTPGAGSRVAELWTMNRDGSEKRRLFYHSVDHFWGWAPPIWSPDGKQIAFSSGGTFVVDSDGTGLRRLSTVSANGLTWQRVPQ